MKITHCSNRNRSDVFKLWNFWIISMLPTKCVVFSRYARGCVQSCNDVDACNLSPKHELLPKNVLACLGIFTSLAFDVFFRFTCIVWIIRENKTSVSSRKRKIVEPPQFTSRCDSFDESFYKFVLKKKGINPSEKLKSLVLCIEPKLLTTLIFPEFSAHFISLHFVEVNRKFTS